MLTHGAIDPTNLVVTPGDEKLDLTFFPKPSASHTWIQYKRQTDTAWTTSTSSLANTINSYSITGLTGGVLYDVRIFGTASSGGTLYRGIFVTGSGTPTGTSASLSVRATPACGSTVTDLSVQPVWQLRLRPPPATETAVDYRPVDVNGNGLGLWAGHIAIRTAGTSIESPRDSAFSHFRGAFPGFAGFKFRLRGDTSVTAMCTWQFDDSGNGGATTPTTPTDTGGGGSGNSGDSGGGGSGGSGGGGGGSGGGGGGSGGGGGGGGGGSSTPALSRDAALGSLAVTAAGGSGDSGDEAAALSLSPAFTPGATAYTLDVPYETGALDITPVARDDNATARIAGQTLTAGQAHTAHLRPGETTVIEITVTAENGRTTRTYTLRITRAAPDTDPTLPALVVTGNDKSKVNLSPVFSPDNTDYSAALSRGIDTLTIIPVLGDARKTVTVNNIQVTGPTGVTLPGTTPVVTIAVTAEDGASTMHYTIALQRTGLPANVSRSDLAEMALSLADATTRSIARRLNNRRAAGQGPGLSARIRSLFPDTGTEPAAFDPVFETARVDNGRERSLRLPGLSSLLPLADTAWSFDKDNPDAPGLWFEGSTLVGHRMDSAHAGFDAVTGHHFTAGAALSWHQASFNHNNDTALAGINPYLRWTGENTTLDVASGLSKGHFRHKDNGNGYREPVEHNYLRAAFAGRLLQRDNLEIALRSEMTRAQLAVGPVSARAGRMRLAVESSATVQLPGNSRLVPSLSVGARRDHGDLAGAGAGVESGAGLTWRREHLSLSARTRLFRTALNTEWGIGAVLDYRHPRGTFVTLSPSYGNAQDSLHQLWDGGLPRTGNVQADGYAPHTPRKQLKADLRAGFTWQAPHRAGLLEPFVEARLQRRPSLRLGTHWTAPGGLTLRLAGERRGGDAGLPADNALLLEAGWRPGR